jgi:hypothetical protein
MVRRRKADLLAEQAAEQTRVYITNFVGYSYEGQIGRFQNLLGFFEPQRVHIRSSIVQRDRGNRIAERGAT